MKREEMENLSTTSPSKEGEDLPLAGARYSLREKKSGNVGMNDPKNGCSIGWSTRNPPIKPRRPRGCSESSESGRE